MRALPLLAAALLALPACELLEDERFSGGWDLSRRARTTGGCPDLAFPDEVRVLFEHVDDGAIRITAGPYEVVADAPVGDPPQIAFTIREEWSRNRDIDYLLADDGLEITGSADTAFIWGSVGSSNECRVTLDIETIQPWERSHVR
jgi:hypothetical protein